MTISLRVVIKEISLEKKIHNSFAVSLVNSQIDPSEQSLSLHYSAFSLSKVYFANKNYTCITHLTTEWNLTYFVLLEIHSEVNSFSLSIWSQAHLAHSCFGSENSTRALMKYLIAKTMSYLLQSVSTEVPCKELWNERRGCENGNLLGICLKTKRINL